MYDDTYLSLQLCTKALLIGLFLHALGYVFKLESQYVSSELCARYDDEDIDLSHKAETLATANCTKHKDLACS